AVCVLCGSCSRAPFSSCLCLSSSTPLFLSRFGRPRDLHSFPTRRSSDLRFYASIAAAIQQGEKNNEIFSYDGPCARRRVHTKILDRKSTRLNSSHGSISYAVFCLKKKKNKIQP